MFEARLYPVDQLPGSEGQFNNPALSLAQPHLLALQFPGHGGRGQVNVTADFRFVFALGVLLKEAATRGFVEDLLASMKLAEGPKVPRGQKELN